jgi:hypothetical protein
MTLFGKDLWIGFLRQLTYVSTRDEVRLREMREDQLTLIEELLHRQAVKLNNAPGR